jgi:hypothetical protein
MAQFGRTRMMGVTIKRFLTQLKRHDTAAYDALPEELRTRYQPSGYLLFGDTKKDAEGRRLLREQVAQDMHNFRSQDTASSRHDRFFSLNGQAEA